MSCVMAGKFEKVIFGAISLVFLSIGYAGSQSTNKPKITGVEDEIIIEANSNYELFCKGQKPMLWSTPRPSEEHPSGIVTIFSQNDERPGDRHYQYGRRLTIKNMTYPYVGYFYCHYKDVAVDDRLGSDKVYVYVNDSEVLSVLNNIPGVRVTQYEEAVIPCRPTAPDIDVELTSFLSEQINAPYDPKLGFTFNATELSQQDYYLCRFNRGSVETELPIICTVDLPTDHIARPTLEDLSYGHTLVGKDLILQCQVTTSTMANFHWYVPSPNGSIYLHNSTERMEISMQSQNGDDLYQNLTIHKTRLSDKGRYYCKVSDYQGHSSSAYAEVDVYDDDDHFIEMTEENNLTEIVTPAGTPAVLWRIDVKGHPIPSLTWFDTDGQEIGNSNKYETRFEDQKTHIQAFLTIKDVTISDFGRYRLIAKNQFEEQTMDLYLTVTDKPTVSIKTKSFYMINEIDTVECVAPAYPEPTISWEFKKCENGQCDFTPVRGQQDHIKSIISLNMTGVGYIRCYANNSYGDDSAESIIYVSDITDGFDIFDYGSTIELLEHNQTVIAALGDSVSMSCGASIHGNYSQVQWLHEGIHISNDTRHVIKYTKTQYSERQRLTIVGANYSDNGNYTCKAKDSTGKEIFKSVTVSIQLPTSPKFVETNNVVRDVQLEVGDKLTLSCEATGIPKPSVSWYKDGVEFKPIAPKVKFFKGNQNLHFRNTNLKDEGTYKCLVANRIRSIERKIAVKFKNVPKAGLPIWAIALICILIVAFIIAMIDIIIKRKKERKLQMQLRKLGLDTFEKGAIENLNPELGVDDQAELLPYDKKWEFPVEQLKLGRQLGSGAFGVVMKAVARRIVDGEESTIVAVKMVKRTADYTHLKALASELKIMVHLGRHLNVVNLIGACTKNVAKKELFVIVEYCRFGNVQNYLLRHRDNFINQVHPETRTLDFTIGQEYLDRTYSISSEKSATGSSLPPNMKDYRGNGYTTNSAFTDMTTLSQGNDCVILSNNSVQPEWRSNYKGDYGGQVKPITTKDLVAWAFQVSRGMEYLASRKVLHGDLAARNILLAENNVVKICDFGLAKSMYKTDNYKKRGNPLLPVKWMAIESIRDRVFSTQSDVWSFGIVLWEFFSLARTPYPGMEANEHLYNKLVDGYRMDPPESSPQQISQMMADCWHVKPVARPSFTDLCERLGDLLEESVRKHYVDLNDPYLAMNIQRLEEGESDYLAMLSPPTFENLSSPAHHYVNDSVRSSPEIVPENEGYLCMKPSTIFSPRVEEKGEVFDFDVNYRKNSKDLGKIPELLPMLVSPTSSEGGMTPTTPNACWNPSYCVLPDDKDNYINMPQCKSIAKEKTTSVPYREKSVHYVNEPSTWLHRSVEIM